jgi:NAD(P)-dependent dehydrogenase (short-subunit alcohol dehydrogenase family)
MVADFDFTGKAVLITGASRGIGRACAIAFAERGARIAVHYNTNRAAAEATRALLKGEGHTLVSGDVANGDQVAAFVAQTIRDLGGLHIVINNAGIYYDHPVDGSDYATWQRAWQDTIGANLIGAANVSFCAAQHMLTHGGGRIVNISSRGAFRGEPTAPAYGASKAGLNAMSQSLAKALAPHGIFVGAVAPGFVETDMAEDYLNGPNGDFIKNESPLHRVAKPEEVAYAALFLASEGAAFSTGTILDVNGASYLRT